MSILCPDELIPCPNYNQGNHLFKLIEKKNETFELETKRNYLTFVHKGSISYSSDLCGERTIEQGGMFMIVLHTKNVIKVPESCTLIMIGISTNLPFCEHFYLGKLYSHREKKDGEIIHILKQAETVHKYLNVLEYYLSNDGMCCSYFFDLQIKELFFLLRTYYSKEELRTLFHPILNKDMEFSELVMKNYLKFKSVQELAESVHYSVAGFQKRFQRVFGITFWKWTRQELARKIYIEINSSNKTMTEIAYQFGFSTSYFNEYCKLRFNATPRQIRLQTNNFMFFP